MKNQLAAASAAPHSVSEWLAASTFVLIAIGVVLALLVIWWGAKLKRQRQATEDAIERRVDDAMPAPPLAASLDDIVPPAPETEPAPVAPAPPPLADMPVVATAAPLDAAPAMVAADDLTRMKGVGPKLATRLGELGITRFAQIAALSPSDAQALDAQLGAFQGRIARDRWIEQAGYLANDDRTGFEAAFGRL